MPLTLQSKPALLIIDMQNGFCHPDGTFAKLSLPISLLKDPVPSINHLRALSHAHSLPIIYTRICFAEDYSDSGIILHQVPAVKDAHGSVRGTWDADVIDELKPDPGKGELVMDKTRNTAFWGTNLEEMLRQRGVDQVIVTGVGTSVCVESTVRDAMTNGFHAVVVSDATATLTHEEHEASLKSMRWFGEIASAEEVEKALEGRKR